jgi:hypothetical protein
MATADARVGYCDAATQGQVRVPYACKECGEKQKTF